MRALLSALANLGALLPYLLRIIRNAGISREREKHREKVEDIRRDPTAEWNRRFERVPGHTPKRPVGYDPARGVSADRAGSAERIKARGVAEPPAHDGPADLLRASRGMPPMSKPRKYKRQ